MAAGTWNFVIEQGATWNLQLTWTDDIIGNPFDLTEYTAHMQVRNAAPLTESGTDLLYLDMTTVDGAITLGGTAGTVLLYLSAAQTQALTFTSAVYDLHLTSGTGEVTKLLEGTVTVIPGITIDSSGPPAVLTGGSGPVTVAIVTSNTTLTNNNYVVLCDPTSAPFTLSLPSAVGFNGILVLAMTGVSTNLVTVTPATGQTIDGVTGPQTLGNLSSTANYNVLTLISNTAAGWVAI